MGRDLAAQEAVVRDTFAEANAVLGFDLTALCFEGPAEELTRTANAQPALVTMSTACWRLLTARGFACDVMAGHSLGEYSALVAAGALTFPDALRLVRRRGEVMAEAAAGTPGTMAAVIGLDDADVVALCEAVAAEHGTLVPANYNAPGQVVVSGTKDAVTALRAIGKARGARVIPLQVSGPFHSPLMAPAAEAFAEALAAVRIAAPTVPIVPNVTAEPTTDPEAIRAALAAQITGSVRWVADVRAILGLGVTRFVEVGPGNVLAGLIGRIDADVQAGSYVDALLAI
jgi:[acyl-carrier-protein] S-malonyltransferase